MANLPASRGRFVFLLCNGNFDVLCYGNSDERVLLVSSGFVSNDYDFVSAFYILFFQ